MGPQAPSFLPQKVEFHDAMSRACRGEANLLCNGRHFPISQLKNKTGITWAWTQQDGTILASFAPTCVVIPLLLIVWLPPGSISSSVQEGNWTAWCLFFLTYDKFPTPKRQKAVPRYLANQSTVPVGFVPDRHQINLHSLQLELAVYFPLFSEVIWLLPPNLIVLPYTPRLRFAYFSLLGSVFG